MKTTAFVSHHDCSRHDTGWGHPDHQGRLPALMREVYRDMLTLFEPLLQVEGRHATEGELQRYHTASYLARVREWVERAAGEGRPLEVGPELVASGATGEASAAAVGCVLRGVEVVRSGEVRNAFCSVRPPAADARADEPGRFGFLNPVLVAARTVLDAGERVLLVEWGGPLSAALRDFAAAEPAVRFASVTAEAPAGASQPADLPGLDAGSTGRDFLALQSERLATVLDNGFEPDIVLLSAGFDGVRGDPLGALALDPADYFSATSALRDVAESRCGGRIVSVLEGGYDPKGLGAAAVQHLRALAGLEPAA